MAHEVDRCWEKKYCNKKLQDPDQCESMAMKPKLARVYEDRVRPQLNPSRTSRSDGQASMP